MGYDVQYIFYYFKLHLITELSYGQILHLLNINLISKGKSNRLK